MSEMYYSDGTDLHKFTPDMVGAAASSHTHSYNDLTNKPTIPTVPSSLKNPNAITIQTNGNTQATYDGSVAKTVNVTPDNIGAVPATEAGTNAALNRLSTGTSVPVDNDYYISQYVSGGTTTNSYHRRPVSALWSYIKGKADSVYQAKGSYAAANHTHNYAGSSSAGGAANSANKLATARTISLGGYSSGSVNFDGSANVTIDDSKLGTVKYVTTNNTTKPYYRVAYTCATGSYSDQSIIMSVDSGYDSGGFGILQFVTRSNDLSTATAGVYYGSIKWLVRYGFAADQFIMKVNSPASSTAANHYVDVYFKATSTYQAVNLRVLSSGSRGTNNTGVWAFTDSSSEQPRAAMDIRTYTAEFKGQDVGTVNNANSATCATYVKDSSSGSNLKITYAKAGQSSTSWLGSWNGTELGAISPAQITAGKATTLATSRTIQTNLASTSSASFNGSANITPGITGTLGLANGGTGATTAANARTNLGLGTAATYGVTTSATSGSTALITSGAVYSALAGKLNTSGGTTTGNITAQTSAATDIGFFAKNTESGVGVSLEVGAGKTNHGVYSQKHDKWLMYADANGTVYLDGKTLGVSVPANAKFTDTNTDTLMTQTATTANASYPLLLSSSTSTGTRTALFDSGVTLNPSTNTIAANVSGNAATATRATKLSASQKGSATQPVYISSDGVPTACTYTLGKSVPSNAVFTDTKQIAVQSTQPTDSNVLLWIKI